MKLQSKNLVVRAMRKVHRNAILSLVALVSVFGLSAAAQSADYYVSSGGNDSNSGTQSSPWQTIGKINGLDLNPGDRVLFQGGQTFGGSLSLSAEDAGTLANPVVISSYGTGRATFSTSSGDAIDVIDAGGVEIKNLNLTGSGSPTQGNGITVYNGASSGTLKLSHAYVDNVDVSGFAFNSTNGGGCGISIGAYNQNNGWDDVRVTNCVAHDNQNAGIFVYAQNPNVNTNVYIGHCTSYHNTGKTSVTRNNGSGIVIGECNGGLIEICVAYDNGINNTPSEGPVGIWAYSSNNVTIQFCESYNNKTSSADGDGFDLDIEVTNSKIQYCYSHGNYGAGYLLYSAGSGNTIRYNISEDDCRTVGYGGITLGGTTNNADVYNNTVYMSSAASSPAGILIDSFGSGPPNNIRIRNNILVSHQGSTGSVALLAVRATSPTDAIQGNDYYNDNGSFSIVWGANTRSSLAIFRTLDGQEKNGAADTGFNVNPLLTNPGNGGTIGNADNLTSLVAYKLQNGSPLINAALNLTAAPFSLNVGARDYYGDTLPQGSGYDVGAHEVAASSGYITRIRYFPRSTQAGRMVGGKFQVSSSADFTIGVVDLFQITTAPADGVWTDAASVAPNSSLRYVRYLSPTGGYGNVAEVEFYNGTTKLTGTSIGTSGSWSGTSSDDRSKAYDGNTSTYFDAPNADGNWTGLDLNGTVTGTGTGLKGEYFADKTLSTLVKSQTDPTVNFDWGSGSPLNTNGTTMASVGPDNFSVRWSGQVQATTTGSYAFSTFTDDGVRLWVGNITGTPAIDKWIDQGTTTYSTSFPMTVGQKYDLKMEYYDSTGGAVAKLFWTPPGGSSVAIPQLQLYPTLGAAPVSVPNSGFETPATTTYIYNPTGGSWTFGGNSGVQKNGSVWYASTAPQGTQTAFLQSNGPLGVITQSVSVPAGTHSVSFKLARRGGQVQPIKVSVGSTVLGTFTAPDSLFQAVTTATWNQATMGSVVLKFEATVTGGDDSSFLDDVRVN